MEQFLFAINNVEVGTSNLSIAEFASASPSLNNLLKKFITLLFLIF
jgi:hypothetical protein